MSKVSVKGVLIGGVVDIGTTMALSFPIAIYLISQIDLSHVPKDQVQSLISAAMLANRFVFALQMLAGFAGSLLGGYVAARVAKHDELLHGTLSCFLCVSMGIYAVAAGKDSHPPAMQLLMFLESPAAGLFGGYLARLRKPVTPPPVELTPNAEA